MHFTKINEHYMVHMNLDVDYEMLGLLAENARYKPIVNDVSSHKDKFWECVNTWQFDAITNPTGYVKELHEYLCDLFQARIVPSFLHQDPNTIVPQHRDSKTLCSVNVLTVDDCSPITFEDVGDITYDCALINTRQRHMVKPHPEDRYLLKFSVKDKTYEECYERLPDSLKLELQQDQVTLRV